MKTAVIGSGTWGTALSMILERNGHDTVLFANFPEEAEMLRKHVHINLPGISLSENIKITTDLQEALLDRDLIVLASPSSFVRSMSARMKPFIRMNQVIVSVSKGIEEDTLMTMSEVIEEELPMADVCVLSGPTHAEEVSRFIPTTITLGAHSLKSATFVQKVFMADCFRVYISPDMKGIEIGGALKNVMALAAGIADGLNYGDNTKAALITRGIMEITRLGVKAGGKMETFYGLSGIGDLVVTCASMHSRNRRAGILIGEGKSLEEALSLVGQTVEGIYAATSGLRMAKKYSVEMPMLEEINRVLFEGKDPQKAVNDLMLRDPVLEIRGLTFES